MALRVSCRKEILFVPEGPDEALFCIRWGNLLADSWFILIYYITGRSRAFEDPKLLLSGEWSPLEGHEILVIVYSAIISLQLFSSTPPLILRQLFHSKAKKYRTRPEFSFPSITLPLHTGESASNYSRMHLPVNPKIWIIIAALGMVE